MTDYGDPDKGNAVLPSWYVYRAQIRNVVVNGNVSKIGNYAFYKYPNLKSVVLGEGVKEVGDRTFYECTLLSELSLPESLEQIGQKFVSYSDYGCSFFNCTSLREITLPVNLKLIGSAAFHGCGIEKIFWNSADCTVAEGYIGYSTLSDCPIEEVDFGDKVKSVSAGAFAGCKSITKVNTKGTIEYVGKNAFEDTPWLGAQKYNGMIYIDHAAYLYSQPLQEAGPVTIVMPEGTTSITDGAVSDNKYLVKVVIPSTVKRIDSGAFSGCSSLNEVEYNAVAAEDCDKAPFSASVSDFMFGDGVKRIPAYLLSGCSGLSEINLPESLESIGEYAFECCGSIKELIIPDKVEEIGRLAMQGMDNVERITIGEGLKKLDCYYIFGQCPKLKHITWNAVELDERKYDPYHDTDLCRAPVETLVFGDKVKYVPGDLFRNCTTLKEVEFGKSVEKIGEAAFRGCSGITHVELPDSLKEICDYAFYGTSIESLFIPQKVQSLGTWGLGNIGSLKSVLSTSSAAPECGSSFIDHADDVVLYIPDYEGYASNGWGQYRPWIQPMIKADAEEFYYDGTIPEVSFACNISGYELVSLSEAAMDGSVGKHSATMTASFKGERDFTTDVVYSYTVQKGLQEISWEQDFGNLFPGKEIVLEANSSAGLKVFYTASNINVELKQIDGKTVMVCNRPGEVELCAYQHGDDNWERAADVSRKITIDDKDVSISGVEMDRQNATILGIYDVVGNRIPALRKGINIVRYSDGTVCKYFVE